MSQLKQVAHFFDRASAEVLKSALVAHGFEAVVLGDDMGGMRPDIIMGTGVRVLVPEHQFADASELMHSFETDSAEEHTDEFADEITDEFALTEESDVQEYAKVIRRAYTAAIYGTFVFQGVAHVYSMFLLLGLLGKKLDLSTSDKRRIMVALLFNVVVITFLVSFILKQILD